MSRRKSVNLTRDIGVDERFRSPIVQKFINIVMERGKKELARSIVYKSFDLIASKFGGDDHKAYALFEKALDQVRPLVECKSRRVGGGVYQVPTEVRPSRSAALAFRWLIASASARKDKTMSARLAYELLDAAEGHGAAVKKKSDAHRLAESNRAFSHFAW